MAGDNACAKIACGNLILANLEYPSEPPPKDELLLPAPPSCPVRCALGPARERWGSPEEPRASHGAGLSPDGQGGAV